MATPLHRHQLVRLSDAGWREVRSRSWDDAAAACLAHWAAQRLPLVVTRQARHAADEQVPDELALGLAAPSCWQRRRIALSVRRTQVAWFDEFPLIGAFAQSLPARGRAAWQGLATALAAVGVSARVYGSHGWQCLTGLDHVHALSDVDLWMGVVDSAQADAAAALLDGFHDSGVPRLDGELVFPDGRAVAWREWRAWRAGRCRAVLAKTLTGAALVPAW